MSDLSQQLVEAEGRVPMCVECVKQEAREG